jgi:AbrB family looped-hinge helix DNA binding protein
MTITYERTSTARARITRQGQISVPKAIRDHLAAGPGDDLVFEPRPDGSAIVRRRARHSILDLAGIAAADAGRIPDDVKELKLMIAKGIADAVAAKADKIERQRKR